MSSTHPEINAAGLWIYEVLSSDSTLTDMETGDRIYDPAVPQGIEWPYIQIRLYDARNISVVNGIVIRSQAWYFVTVVHRATLLGGNTVDIDDMLPMAQRFRTLLHLQTGSNALGRIEVCTEVRPHQIDYQSSGYQYRELGGLYKLEIGPPP